MNHYKEQEIEFSQLIEKHKRMIIRKGKNSKSYTIHPARKDSGIVDILGDSNDFYDIEIEVRSSLSSTTELSLINIDSIEGLEKFLLFSTRFYYNPYKSSGNTLNKFSKQPIGDLLITVPSFYIFQPLQNTTGDCDYIVPAISLIIKELTYELVSYQNYFLLFVKHKTNDKQFLEQLQIKEWCFMFDERGKAVNLEKRVKMMRVWINESILETI